MTLNRTIAPSLKPLYLPTLSNPKEVLLGVLSMSKDQIDVFRLDIVFPKGGSGNSLYPKSAVLCAEMLLSGTKELSAQELNEQLDYYGSYVSISTSYYKTLFTVYGLNKYFKEIVELVNKAINHSNFPQDELDTIIHQKVAGLKIQQQKTNYQSKVLMNKLWFGETTVLGHETKEEDYENITKEKLEEEYQQNFQEFFALISSGGNQENQALLLKSLFSNKLVSPTSFDAKEIDFQKIIPSKDNEVSPIANSIQSSFCARVEVPSRNTEDYATLSMLNLIFGGYFGSRLMKNIREEKGWTYGVSSQIKNYKSNAFIEISGDIKADTEEKVKIEIGKEIARLKTELVSEEELETAKNYYLGNLQSAFDNFLSLGERHISLLETENSLEWYNGFAKSIHAIQSEELRSCANNYLDFESLVYTWSGPKQ